MNLANILGNIGPAPASLSLAERRAWDEILGHSLPGAYTEYDRVLVEFAARNLAEYRSTGCSNHRLQVGLILLFRDLFLPTEAVMQLLVSDSAPSTTEASL